MENSNEYEQDNPTLRQNSLDAKFKANIAKRYEAEIGTDDQNDQQHAESEHRQNNNDDRITNNDDRIPNNDARLTNNDERIEHQINQNHRENMVENTGSNNYSAQSMESMMAEGGFNQHHQQQPQ